jgi:hypothetical protein
MPSFLPISPMLIAGAVGKGVGWKKGKVEFRCA